MFPTAGSGLNIYSKEKEFTGVGYPATYDHTVEKSMTDFVCLCEMSPNQKHVAHLLTYGSSENDK